MKWLQHAYDSIGRRHRQRRHLAVLFQIPIAGADREHGISLNPPMVGDVKNGRRKRARHHLRRPRAKRNRMVGIRADGPINRITDRVVVGSSSRRGAPQCRTIRGSFVWPAFTRTLPIPYQRRTVSAPARTRLAHQGQKNGPRHQGAGGAMAAPGVKGTCSNHWFFFRIRDRIELWVVDKYFHTASKYCVAWAIPLVVICQH